MRQPLDRFARLPAGDPSGVITDPASLLLPNVSVTVINPDSALQRSEVTNSNGTYRFPALPIGNHTVKVDINGFKSGTGRNLILDVAQEAVANFTMQVGATGQSCFQGSRCPETIYSSSEAGLSVMIHVGPNLRSQTRVDECIGLP